MPWPGPGAPKIISLFITFLFNFGDFCGIIVSCKATLEALNAKTLAWIAESPETRGGGLIHTDLALWAEDGVTDVDSFERWSLATDIYYMLKDEGLRANWSELFSLSLEELKKQCSHLTA